jgi:8-oxo-dGTP pyrophosphatase MutT (NUDIX family)
VSRREVLIVVHRGDEFLALLRSPQRGGYWNPPAGGVEEGETAADAARRELAEETGLVADVEELGLELAYERPDGAVVQVDAFSAAAPPGWEPVLDEEHVDRRWCSEDEALRLLAYPEPREALRAAARRRETVA